MRAEDGEAADKVQIDGKRGTRVKTPLRWARQGSRRSWTVSVEFSRVSSLRDGSERD